MPPYSFHQWSLLSEATLPSAIKSYGEKMAKTLDSHEIRLLRHYSNELYNPVNAVMRGRSSYSQFDKPSRVGRQGFHRMMGGAGNVLSKIFAKYALPEPVTVYRFTGLDAFMISAEKYDTAEYRSLNIISAALAADKDVRSKRRHKNYALADYYEPLITFMSTALQGKTVRMRGLVSTTTDLNVALQFKYDTGWKPGIILQSTLPRGTSAIPLVRSLSENPIEAEILLPDNAQVSFLPQAVFAKNLAMVVHKQLMPVNALTDVNSIYEAPFVLVVPVTFIMPPTAS